MPNPRDAARTSPYREDLCRTATFQLTRAVGDDRGDGLTIDGYGAVFNSPTHISSWEGDFDEVIAPGAFKKSLRESTPKMQFDHGRHPLLGSLPLGRWDVAEEDNQGLHLVGRLTDNWLVQPFRDAIRDGGVNGMSFRFSVVREDWTDNDGKNNHDSDLSDLLWYGAGDRGPLLRTLRELKVSEAGPVMWPAYEDTSVGVRDHDGRRTVVIDLGQLIHGDTGEKARLAKLVAMADRASAEALAPADGQTCDTCGESDHLVCYEVKSAPQTPDLVSGEPESSEPRSTETPADEHPPHANGAPPVTDTSAGEHSPNASIPANPRERAEFIRREFRGYTNRVLALTPSSTKKGPAQ